MPIAAHITSPEVDAVGYWLGVDFGDIDVACCEAFLVPLESLDLQDGFGGYLLYAREVSCGHQPNV